MYRGTSIMKKRPPPQDPPRTLGIVLLQDPSGRRFCMSEVPLRVVGVEMPCRGTSLTGKRTPPGPYRRPLPRVLRGNLGGWECFDGRGAPVKDPNDFACM